MPTTAQEINGNLFIDFGDGTDYTVYPVPGAVGIEIQALLVGVALGVTMNEQGPEAVMENTERLAQLSLGMPVAKARKLRKAPNQSGQASAARYKEFQNMRAARQMIVSQAAILWNTGGGSIEAVNDLFNEAGGYPKALGRVMQSSGLGDKYELLRTWLSSAGNTSETDSTNSPIGGPNTSA